MRFDDRLATVLSQPVGSPHDRAVRWRQLVDLVARSGGQADRGLLDKAIELIRADRAAIRQPIRAAAARSIAASPSSLPACVLTVRSTTVSLHTKRRSSRAMLDMDYGHRDGKEEGTVLFFALLVVHRTRLELSNRRVSRFELLCDLVNKRPCSRVFLPISTGFMQILRSTSMNWARSNASSASHLTAIEMIGRVRYNACKQSWTTADELNR